MYLSINQTIIYFVNFFKSVKFGYNFVFGTAVPICLRIYTHINPFTNKH